MRALQKPIRTPPFKGPLFATFVISNGIFMSSAYMLRQLRLLGNRRPMIEKSMQQTIRRLIDENANLSTPARDLAPDSDLYRAGLRPFMAIRLMLALERQFGVEFPKRMLNRQSMSSIDAIRGCICELEQRQALPKAA